MSKWREIVANRMIELDMTQAELAKELKVGRSTVGHWVTGEREPRNLEDFESLAKVLHLDPAKLLTAVAQKNSNDISDKDELSLLLNYRKLSNKDKVTVKSLIEALPKHRA